MRTLRAVRDDHLVFREVLLDLDEFRTNKSVLTGTRRSIDYHMSIQSFGRLPEDWHTLLRSSSYIVRSYATPILWWHPNLADAGWVFPEVTYSVITSRHQDKLRRALEGFGYYIDPDLKVKHGV